MLLRMFSDVFWPNRGSLARRPSSAAASSSGSESMPRTSWIWRILATPSPEIASISTRPGGICSRSSSSMLARPVLTSSVTIWSVAGPTPLAAASEPSSRPWRRSPRKARRWRGRRCGTPGCGTDSRLAARGRRRSAPGHRATAFLSMKSFRVSIASMPARHWCASRARAAPPRRRWSRARPRPPSRQRGREERASRPRERASPAARPAGLDRAEAHPVRHADRRCRARGARLLGSRARRTRRRAARAASSSMTRGPDHPLGKLGVVRGHVLRRLRSPSGAEQASSSSASAG